MAAARVKHLLHHQEWYQQKEIEIEILLKAKDCKAKTLAATARVKHLLHQGWYQQQDIKIEILLKAKDCKANALAAAARVKHLLHHRGW